MSLASRLLISASLLGLSCVEPNHGARIIANFQTLGPPAAVTVAGATTPFLTPHYEMWATIRKDVVVDLVAFDVTSVVDPNSPCLMYDSAAEQAYPGEVTAGEPIMAPL